MKHLILLFALTAIAGIIAVVRYAFTETEVPFKYWKKSDWFGVAYWLLLRVSIIAAICRFTYLTIKWYYSLNF